MTERTPADVTAAIAPCTARAMVAAGIEPGPIKRRKPSCVAIGARGLLSRLHVWIDSAIIGKTGGGLVMRGLRLARQDELEKIFARYAAQAAWMREVGIYQ